MDENRDDMPIVLIDATGSGMGERTFGSMDEFFEWQAEQERIANEGLSDAQKQIVWGSYWVTVYPGLDNLVVYGQCLTEQENIDSELEAGAEPDEVDYTIRTVRDSYSRGYRYGRCYSVVEPEGEWGSTHIGNMVGPITEAQFNQAQEAGWDAWSDDVRAWLAPMVLDHYQHAMRQMEQTEQENR